MKKPPIPLMEHYTFIMPTRVEAGQVMPCARDKASHFQVWGWHIEERDWWQLDVVYSYEEATVCAANWERATLDELKRSESAQ